MKRLAKKIKSPVARPRSWRVSLIRKRAQVLGDVEAASREAAELAAVQQFNLTRISASGLSCRSAANTSAP
jgi:hypothetical protein